MAEAEEIALVAVGLDRTEREAYLRRRTAGDVEMLAEVRRRLVFADRVPEDFLERTGVELLDGRGEPTLDGSSRDGPEAATRELPFAEGRRYRLAEPLGAGGMAVVFRAFDQRLQRPVAIKHLHVALAEDPRALTRFEREARATARVSHPAIVEVFDVLRDGDDLWIVMELVPGQSLASRLEEGPLEIGEALSLGAEIAGGLAAAHAQGIVHRDLKAANVMVTPESRSSASRIKILDFGLAKSVSEDDSLTAGGELRGTPTCMSPEQVSRSGVDARSDLFSFGALLYRMVTGTSPFEGSSLLVTLERIRDWRPPPANRLNPRVPEDLSSLIEALLEKDPERRPQETAAVARTLARLAESTTASAVHWAGDRAPTGSAADVAFPSAAAERRHVTVLTCRLVGGGSGRLFESEETLELEAPFWELAGPILERWSAHLGERLDVGLRAYFGYPRATEDDPRRGVSAALDLVAAVARWSAGSGFDPTAGIRLEARVHTGWTVVTTRPDGRRQLVLGRTGCCATEMTAPADSAGVLVSSATRRLARGRFRFEPLGVCPLGRCEAPVEIYRALAASPEGEEASPPELTPFAGREAELELLRQRFGQAAEGRGRVVLVSGEAGSGKSRLVRVFRQLLGAGPGAWREVSCRPATSRTPLAMALSRALGCEGEEEPEVLARRLAEGAEEGAAVLVVEDVHFADPSDLELLGLLVDRAPAARLLILLTCRPPFEAPWKMPLHLTVCSLGPLTTDQAKRMIRHLTAGRDVPAAAQQRILAATDGVPRFVEELTRTSLTSNEGADSVPDSLRGLFTARLDRLGSAREVARAASVLGREFTREQLSALLPAAGDTVARGLDRLVEAEILHRRGGRRAGVYRFCRALLRHAAYESLLGEHRRLYEQRARESSSSSSRAATRSGSPLPSVNQP